MRLVLIALVTLVAAASAQTFCSNYATALSFNESFLMETVIGDVVGRVVADPVTVKWFTGVNNKNNIDFTAGGAPLNGLVQKLIAFFGAALGCTQAPDFATGGKYTIAGAGGTSNMTSVHSGFNVPVTKAAYEAFNIHIIDSLRSFGVSNADLTTVASVIDVFRGPTLHTTAGTDKQVCQNTDCNTSPFTVHAADVTVGSISTNYFAPSYLTIPNGGTIQFVNKGSRTHVPTQGTYVASGACTAASGGFTQSLAVNATYTTPALKTAGTVTYYCQPHCPNFPAASQMVGTLNVLSAAAPTTSGPSPSTTSGAASFALGFAALFAALVASLM